MEDLVYWGAIKDDDTKVLYKCSPILNSKKYQKVLDTELIPLLNKDSVVMQDGEPCHRSQSTLHFLDSRQVCLVSD